MSFKWVACSWKAQSINVGEPLAHQDEGLRAGRPVHTLQTPAEHWEAP